MLAVLITNIFIGLIGALGVCYASDPKRVDAFMKRLKQRR